MKDLGLYERMSAEQFAPVQDALDQIDETLRPRVNKRVISDHVKVHYRTFSDTTAFEYEGDRVQVKRVDKHPLGSPELKWTRVYHEQIFPGIYDGEAMARYEEAVMAGRDAQWPGATNIASFEFDRLTEEGVDKSRTVVFDHDKIDESAMLKGTIRTGLKFGRLSSGDYVVAPIVKMIGFTGQVEIDWDDQAKEQFVQLVKFEPLVPQLYIDTYFDRPTEYNILDLGRSLSAFRDAEEVRQTYPALEVEDPADLHTEEMRDFDAMLREAGLRI